MSAVGRASGIEASAAADVGNGTTVGAGTVPAANDVVSSTAYDRRRWAADTTHHGSNVATTDGVEPGAK